ncbi:MAG: hypothetical protein WAV41_01110 [Microgenomates group bacterium]
MDDEKFREYYKKLKASAQMMDAVNKDIFALILIPRASDFHKEIAEHTQKNFETMLGEEEGLTLEQLRALKNITYLTPRGENPDSRCVGHLQIIEPMSKTDAWIKDMPASEEKMYFLMMGVGRPQAEGVKTGYIDVILDRKKR